jgi:hypothetical protein
MFHAPDKAWMHWFNEALIVVGRTGIVPTFGKDPNHPWEPLFIELARLAPGELLTEVVCVNFTSLVCVWTKKIGDPRNVSFDST